MTTLQDLSGRQLGDYKLLKKFASGGMAHIYLGQDTNLGRNAAVKVLTPDMAGADDILKERFEREARAIANLDHPNIVPVYQFHKVENENLYFLAMRYVEGNDLADEVKKYRDRGELMPPSRWLPILEQVAAALDHAHLKGIIHRDVKPSNILLDAQGRAFLSDFGLVLWEEMDKTLGTAFGTPRYISPEQATDSQQAVSQSDIYSLAVIVYELVTGRVLFKGKTPMEVALSHITEQPTPPRQFNTQIPANAQNAIMKSLQKDAAKRHRTATEFIKELQNAYDVLPPVDEQVESNFEAVGTVAFRPEDLEEDVSESSREILDSWDSVEEVEDTVVEPIPSPSRKSKSSGGLRLPLIGAGLVVVVIAAFAAMNFLGSGVVGGGAVNMLLQYNDNFFAIKNIAETDTLLIGDLNIMGRPDETQGRAFGNELAPNECVLVLRNNASPSDVPGDWDCDTSRRITVGSSTEVFWRADTEQDKTFSVNVSGGRRVTTCDTFGRIVGRTSNLQCRVAWPNVMSNETEG